VRVLVVNAGSSSLKHALVHAHAGGGTILARGEERWEPGESAGRHAAALAAALADAGGGADAIGHRVVHGGTRFTTPVLIDRDVRAAIAALAPPCVVAPEWSPALRGWLVPSDGRSVSNTNCGRAGTRRECVLDDPRAAWTRSSTIWPVLLGGGRVGDEVSRSGIDVAGDRQQPDVRARLLGELERRAGLGSRVEPDPDGLQAPARRQVVGGHGHGAGRAV
jgi:hypothetical protein